MDMSKPALLAAADRLDEVGSFEDFNTAPYPRSEYIDALKLAADLFRLAADASDGFEAWLFTTPAVTYLKEPGLAVDIAKQAWQAATLAASVKYEQRIAEQQADIRNLCAEVRRCQQITKDADRLHGHSWTNSKVVAGVSPRVREILEREKEKDDE